MHTEIIFQHIQNTAPSCYKDAFATTIKRAEENIYFFSRSYCTPYDRLFS